MDQGVRDWLGFKIMINYIKERFQDEHLILSYTPV